MTLIEEQAAEIERLEAERDALREENARYKLTYAKYVEATDRMNGTPCEQIRHQQEVEALRDENARLVDLLDDVLAQWDGDWPEDLYARVKAAIREETTKGEPSEQP